MEVALPDEAGGAVGPEQLELVLVVAAAVLVAEDPNEVVPDFVVARRVAGCCAVLAVTVALVVRPSRGIRPYAPPQAQYDTWYKGIPSGK